MAFVIVGVLLLAMKFGELGPVANWSWFIVLAPFGLAVLWWSFADSTGLTQRRAIDKMEQRKADRRKRDMEALGLDAQRDKQIQRARAAARKAAASETSSGESSRRDP